MHAKHILESRPQLAFRLLMRPVQAPLPFHAISATTPD